MTNYLGVDRLEVGYSTPHGHLNWRSKRASQELPDRWPYGLDRLGGFFDSVEPVDLEPISITDVARVVVRASARLSADAGRTRATLAWDEGTAVRMIYQRPASRRYAGVIWATDDAVRGTNVIRTRVLREHLRQLDRLWCLSSGQIAPTADWLGIDKSRIAHLVFGIDQDFFHSVDYPIGPPLIVSFGNDRDRDTETLFAALDQTIRKNPGVRAYVQTNSTVVAPAGVKVIEKASHRKVHELYGRASLAMVATKPNLHGSGMTVALEAMATGRPVVVSDTPGMADYVHDGVTGYRVAESDPDAMALAAQSLLDDRERAVRMGRLARAAVERSFNTGVMADRLADLILDDLRCRRA